MDRKIVYAIAALALVAVLVSVSLKAQGEVHHLISAEKAEAFQLFEQWMTKHSKKYRET